MAGNRGRRVTRASLKQSGPTGREEPPEFAKGMGKNSLRSQNKELVRNSGLCEVVCSSAHASLSPSVWLDKAGSCGSRCWGCLLVWEKLGGRAW